MQVDIVITPEARNDLANLLAARSPAAAAGTAVPMAFVYLDAVEAALRDSRGHPIGSVRRRMRSGEYRYFWRYETGIGVMYELEDRRPGLFGVQIRVVSFRLTR